VRASTSLEEAVLLAALSIDLEVYNRIVVADAGVVSLVVD
jgi:hypothetical protein